MEVYFILSRIGTERRSMSSSRQFVPGPGAYNLSTSIGRAPKYSIASKNSAYSDPFKYVVSPGPGMYTPRHNFTNVSYTYYNY